jgi:hypothetical protein
MRAPEVTPPDTPTTVAPVRRTASVQPAPATASRPALVRREPEPEPAAQPSVQEIAEEVWALIRDRVRVERERLGRP